MQEFLITAVDIGTKNISASCGKYKNGEEVEIIGSSCIESAGIERGKLIDKKKCKIQFLNALKKLEEENHVDISSVYVGVSANNFRIEEVSKNINVEGIISKDNIIDVIKKCKRNINIEKHERICDIIINYYKVDDKITYNIPEGLQCYKLEVNITISIMDREVIENYKYLCEDTKYFIEDFIVNGPSLKNIFLNGNRRGTKFIIGMGASLTEIVKFKNGKVTSVIDIPLGGDDITSDISICANLKKEDAEELKCKYSENLSNFKVCKDEEKELKVSSGSIHKELFYKVCNARIEEILKYVKNELKKASHFTETCSIILYGESLTNFDKAQLLVREIIGTNAQIITKDDFGMNNFNDLTSLAIVKEIHDKVELLYKNSSEVIEEFKKIESNYQSNEEVIDNKEVVIEVEEKESKKSIVGKLRSFLGDIF